jgi:predicted  nucleic acid-binding Zn-ribbon protein
LSIPEQIRALEILAALDAELKILDEEHAQERGTLEGLKGSLKKLDEKLQVDRAALGAMEKTRGEFIADVRNMNQQLEHSRDKLGRSRTERESNAAQRELEELRKLVRDREDEIGKLTADSEAARQQIEVTEEEWRKVNGDLSAREGDINTKVGAIDVQRQAKRTEREAAVKHLPAQLYRRYDMIRQKKGFAIAQTSDGTCRACNMQLPPQLFHRLRREPVLEQCPSCQRIIYFVAPAPAASDGKGEAQGKASERASRPPANEVKKGPPPTARSG